MASEELDALYRQKEALASRTDLSEEEKDKLARTLRRKIRKLRDPQEERPAAQRRVRESNSRSGRHAVRLASDHPEDFEQFKAEVMEWLTDIPLEYKQQSDLIQNRMTGHGISLVMMFEEDITGDQIMEKFHDRWANKEPTWFSMYGEGFAEVLLLGPLPVAMIQG